MLAPRAPEPAALARECVKHDYDDSPIHTASIHEARSRHFLRDEPSVPFVDRADLRAKKAATRVAVLPVSDRPRLVRFVRQRNDNDR